MLRRAKQRRLLLHLLLLLLKWRTADELPVGCGREGAGLRLLRLRLLLRWLLHEAEGRALCWGGLGGRLLVHEGEGGGLGGGVGRSRGILSEVVGRDLE